MSELAAFVSGAVLIGRSGSYRTEGELRRGGMGSIVLAYAIEDAHQQRPLVIKLSLGDDELARGRMQQEVAALAALHHPRIVQVVDEGRIDGHSWYAMEYVGPCNLGDILLVRSAEAPSDLPSLIIGIVEAQLPMVERRSRVGLPIATAVTVMIEVAQTVAHAHGQGVVHRDLKPANILLSDSGEPVLCDFGVARGQGFNLNLTAMDEVVGTFDYLAPELLQGYDADEAADCFAIGAMLYESVTGQLPPRRQYAWQPLPALAGVPRPLAAIIRHSLHPNPHKRQRSAQALAEDLRRFQRGVAVRAPRLSWWNGMVGFVCSRPMLSGFLVSAFILLSLAIGAMQAYQQHRQFAWQQPVIHLYGPRLSIESFPHRDAQWHNAPSGQGGFIASTHITPLAQQDHVLLAMPVPTRMGHKVAIEVDTRAAEQEVSLFLSAQVDAMNTGYVIQLGAYDNSAMVLRRGPQILWMQEYRMQPQQRIRLTLERRGDSITFSKNGAQVVSLRDVLPYAISYAGVLTYVYHNRSYPDPPHYRSFSVSTIDVPPLVGVDWLLTSYAMASEGTSGVERSSIANQGVAFADSIAQRLASDDQRHPMLALRRERLRMFVDDRAPHDLSQHSQHLGAVAEYHLHHLQQLPQGAFAQATQVLHQARMQLSKDEFARLVVAAERVLHPQDVIAIADDIIVMIEDQPILRDFILQRVAVRISDQNLYSEPFWRYLRMLADTGRDNFWTRQARTLTARLDFWDDYRQRWLMSAEHPLAGGDALVQQWRRLLRAGSWQVEPDVDYHSSPDKTAVYASAIIDSLRVPPLPEDYPLLDGIYSDGAWGRYPYRVLAGIRGTLDVIRYEQSKRHFAALLMVASDPEEMLSFMSAYTGLSANGGSLELAVAAVVRDVWQSTVLLPDEGPLQGSYEELILWLRDPQGHMPAVTVDLQSSLGPLLYLALAQHHHYQGRTDKAEETLIQVRQAAPLLPAGQVAQAILQWGWPP